VELDDVDWLDIRADQLGGEEAYIVPGDTGMEEAVEVMPQYRVSVGAC
jgi:hypothetical protein